MGDGATVQMDSSPSPRIIDDAAVQMDSSPSPRIIDGAKVQMDACSPRIIDGTTGCVSLLREQFEKGQATPTRSTTCNRASVQQLAKTSLEERKHAPEIYTYENYPMQSNPRGHMLLINNYKFKDYRYGWQSDSENLVDVFTQQLGFDIQSHENLEHVDMLTKIEEFGNNEKHLSADMCVVCILSHGTKSGITGVDSVPIKLENVIDLVNTDCLRGKPKFFIFQSCRGRMSDYGVPVSGNKYEKDGEDECVPTFEDIVILYSTIPEYMSFRDRESGSWLIQALCKVFCDCAGNTELLDMLRFVAKNVRQEKSDEGEKQTIEVSLRHFTKKLYFNPLLRVQRGVKLKKISIEERKANVNIQRELITSETCMNKLQENLPSDYVPREYKMNHSRRGKAYIFNQFRFDDELNLAERRGTEKDCKNLKDCLEKIGFEIEIFHDLKTYQIETTISEAAAEDHSDADCIFVAALTHGTNSKQNLFARDGAYNSDILWNSFTSDRCSSLTGKPKIIVIQACRGNNKDMGTKIQDPFVQTDCLLQKDLEIKFKIPTHADFVVSYSTIPGFVSSRDSLNGTYFIQIFVEVLSKEAKERDFLSMLTRVHQKVALDYLIGEEKCTQMPCVTSMLTRSLYFDQELQNTRRPWSEKFI